VLAVQLIVQGEPLHADDTPSARRHVFPNQFNPVVLPVGDNAEVEVDGGKSSSEDGDKPPKPCRSEYDNEEMGGKSKDRDKDDCAKNEPDDTWWIVLVCVACGALVIVSALSVFAYVKCRKPRNPDRYCRRTTSLNSVRPELTSDKGFEKDESYIRPPSGSPPPSRTPPPQHVWTVQEGGVNPAAGPPPYLHDVPKYSSIA